MEGFLLLVICSLSVAKIGTKNGRESFFLTQRCAKVGAKVRKEESGFWGGGTGFEPVTYGLR